MTRIFYLLFKLLNLCYVFISKMLRFELMTHSFGPSVYVKDYQINLLSVILYRNMSKYKFFHLFMSNSSPRICSRCLIDWNYR